MAGNNIESDGKLQFYPTDILETYRILGVLSGRPKSIFSTRDEFREVYGKDKYFKIYEENKHNDYENIIFEDLLHNQKYNLINKYIKCNLGYHDTSKLVVADLFAGEGKWLKLFKELSNCGILIGNELEENRYNTMIKDGLVDYHYNLAFEELQLPKRIVNLMLFNPPYGTSNGEANVRRYLRMTLERELMVKNGVVVMVVKKRDALLCADLIAKYFNEDILCYKTNETEFDKWGQVVIYAKLSDSMLDLNNTSDVVKYKSKKETIENMINLDLEFDISFYNYLRINNWKECDLEKAFNDFKYIKNNKISHSNIHDKAWKWLLQETEIKDLSEEIITIPKNLKSGELANVIASGKINGELSLDDNVGKHIAVGGVKTVKSEKVVTLDDKKTGKQIDKKETTIQSVPYLNLLINDKGKMKIKELKDVQESGE